MVFALGEVFIFAWIFGMERGWQEITRGADMNVPRVFRYVIQYVTPVFISIVFVGALVKPVGRWGAAIRSVLAGEGWPLAPDSVIGKVLHVGDPQYEWFDGQGNFTNDFVQDATRILLMLVFLACAALVWRAWALKRRRTP